MSWLWWPLFGWAVMAVAMLLAWSWQRRSGQAGIVDVVWTFGVGGLAVVYAAAADGNPARRLLVAALAGCWSLRLGTHLLARLRRHGEDERYRRLKAAWGEAAQRRMLWFFQSQAAAAPLFAWPMLIASRAAAPLGIWDAAGVALGCGALAAEWLADRQLAQFRAQAGNRGQVCQVGLWRYSRHPNYFFEWIHWWSYTLLAVHAPFGWLTPLAPLAMLYFLCCVTGIPPAEAQALASRGDAYREYQRKTSALIPLPPRG